MNYFVNSLFIPGNFAFIFEKYIKKFNVEFQYHPFPFPKPSNPSPNPRKNQQIDTFNHTSSAGHYQKYKKNYLS